jgi:hypothetical protein
MAYEKQRDKKGTKEPKKAGGTKVWMLWNHGFQY